MSVENTENTVIGLIADKLDNPVLNEVFTIAAEGSGDIDLQKEVLLLERCIQKANELILAPDLWDDALEGVNHSRNLLVKHRYASVPNPFDVEHPPSLRDLINIIRVANTETGFTYKNPTKINDGDPLSVFRWYFWDGASRMIAQQMDVPIEDRKQEEAGDWLVCAFSEAAVVLAEDDDTVAQELIRHMLDMGFIAKGWQFSDQLVERAEAFKD